MKFFVVVCFSILSLSAVGQVRLHIGGGVSNYIGDIQQKRLGLSEADGMFSLGGSIDITNRIGVRFDYSQGAVGGHDSKSTNEGVRIRNLNFRSQIKEAAFLLEYTWNNEFVTLISPYAFVGIGVFNFNPYTNDSAGNKVFLAPLSTEGQGLSSNPDRKPYALTQFNIPAGGGIKVNLSEYFFVGVEAGFRKLFTDYIDDVSLSYADRATLLAERGQQAVSLAFRSDEIPPFTRTYPKAGQLRGNPDKDWYYFMQLRASVKLSWFSGGAGGAYSKDAKRRLGCPARW